MVAPPDPRFQRDKISKSIARDDDGLLERRVKKSRKHVGEVMILFLKFEDQGLDRNLEMLGKGFLEIDQLQVDAVAIVQGIDLVDAFLKVDLVFVNDSCISGARVGDDVNISELQICLLEAKGNGRSGNASRELDPVVALFFCRSDQLSFAKECRRGVGMKKFRPRMFMEHLTTDS